MDILDKSIFKNINRIESFEDYLKDLIKENDSRLCHKMCIDVPLCDVSELFELKDNSNKQDLAIIVKTFLTSLGFDTSANDPNLVRAIKYSKNH